MNKKKIALLIAGIMTIASLALVGCGKDDSSSDANKGQAQGNEQKEEETKTYSYKKDVEKETTVINLTYKKGKPVDVVIDSIQGGKSKRDLCAKGEYIMKKDEKNNWAQQMDLLTAFIKENDFDLGKVVVAADTNKTDVVTGVTIKVNDYVAAVKEAMAEIKAGSLHANEDLKFYEYKEDDDKGTTVVELKYYDGKPVDLSIDYIQEGKSKRELCAKGEYIMKEGEEFNWAQQVDKLTAFIKENKFDVTKVGSSKETQTTDVVTGVSIKVNDYVAAVNSAMEQIKAGTLAEAK